MSAGRIVLCIVSALMAAIPLAAHAQDTKRVNAGNFTRAETDRYFAGIVRRSGLGELGHYRAPADIDDQSVIRMNRDTLYSSGVFDLRAAPVTITLPDLPDGRYMAAQVVSEDHYTPAVYHGGSHVITEEDVGTRYAAILIRTFADPADPADLAGAHAAQDAVTLSQAAKGTFEVPDWDSESLDKARQALLGLVALGLPEGRRRMGTEEEVDPVSHLIATAAGWGLNPETEALYFTEHPDMNDGTVVHSITLKDVPVDGFWSISVYNAGGYFEKNPAGAYAVNNVTAVSAPDGSVTVRFGGCDDGEAVANCLPVTPGWNYVLRLYRPKPEVLDGSWQVPVARPVG